MLLNNRKALRTYFEKNFKPKSEHKTGVEYEFFIFTKEGERVPYDSYTEVSIVQILESFCPIKWQRYYEQSLLLGIKSKEGTVSLEPGGQVEYAGIPFQLVSDIAKNLSRFMDELTTICDRLGVVIIQKGYDNTAPLSEAHWVPKNRYNIMRNLMPTKGELGISMMRNTCSMQVNIDYSDEEDLIKKYKTAIHIQPFLSAISSNSPHIVGQKSYQNYRLHIWQHTDNDRCGLPIVSFQKDFSLDHYIDLVLQTPTYFIIEHGKVVDISLQAIPFSKLLKEEAGLTISESDWITHISTLFLEARIKNTIELRGIDSQPLDFSLAMLTFTNALIYHPNCFEITQKVLATPTFEDINKLYYAVPTEGINAKYRNTPVKIVFQQFIAEILPSLTNEEQHYIAPLIHFLS